MYIVYILKLASVGGFFIGFTESFTKRLLQHINGDGAGITKLYGVRATVHKEVAHTIEAAKLRVTELWVEYSLKGFQCWTSHRKPSAADSSHVVQEEQDATDLQTGCKDQSLTA